MRAGIAGCVTRVHANPPKGQRPNKFAGMTGKDFLMHVYEINAADIIRPDKKKRAFFTQKSDIASFYLPWLRILAGENASGPVCEIVKKEC